METVQLARMAMATRFELVLSGDDPVRLRAAGEEALREIERLDAQLSFYRDTSDVSRLNRGARSQDVQVDGRVFELLERAKVLWQLTDGAFDPTVGPLMKCWGLTGREGTIPDAATLQRARLRTGMQLVELDRRHRTVRFLSDGVEIDLGGIGKGFAVDEALRIVREAGITSALIHGGTSTVSSIGTAVNQLPWQIAIAGPDVRGDNTTDEPGREEQPEREPDGGGTPSGPLIGLASLNDSSLSVSAVGSKFFEIDGVTYSHILDPRTGSPCTGVSLAAVQCDSATDADALSTALLVASAQERELIADRFPDAKLLVADANGDVVLSGFQSAGTVAATAIAGWS